MVRSAASGGLERIVYLGGLGIEDPSLSKHLRSRMEVARILQAGAVPTTFLDIPNAYGHDAFLLPSAELSTAVTSFLANTKTRVCKHKIEGHGL